MNREDHRVIIFDNEEIKDLFNGDENFSKQLSEEYFYWFDAKFKDKYFMKGITKPDEFNKILKFYELTNDKEGLIKMNNKIGERLLEYDLFTYVTLDYLGKLYNKTHK